MILASESAILTCFIHQKSCSGSCNIPAAMKLAEKSMPSGSPQIRYGLLVYAGIRYAMINATAYTNVIVTYLDITNFP